MKSGTCRSCLAPLTPVFRLPDAPRSAQGLPSRAELGSETGADLEVFQCTGCGLIQLDCVPVPYYREVITAAGLSPSMRAFRQSQIGDFVERFELRGKTVLELGSGQGHFLEILDASGARAIGLEAGTANVEAGRSKGRDLLQGYLCDDPGPELGSLDAFITINFLEHAPDPLSLLRRLARLLPGGAPGLLEVPSFEHMVESGRFFDFIADHLSYFTRESLTHLLESAGFEVIECRRVWQGYDLEAVVRKRKAFDAAPWVLGQEALCRELRAFLEARTSDGQSIAVWGASHQALTVLALARAREIAYVIDSAPFKQGRYTPVVHTPIVPPETLQTRPVGTVLVMAAGYSDEVVQILRDRYGFRGHIAVLRGATLEVVQSSKGAP